MSDIDRLNQKLARLAGPIEAGDGAGRVLAGSGPEALLAAMLEEIDETVFARDLRFETDSGAVLVFEVANRRLLALKEASPAVPGLAPQALGDTDQGAIESLRPGLIAFLQPAQRLRVSATRPERAPDPGDIGCSVAVLTRLWLPEAGLGPISPPPSPERLADGFADAFGEIASAGLLLRDDAPVARTGPEDAVARLQQTARDIDRLRAKLSACLRDGGTGGYVAALDWAEDSQTLILASAGPMTALLLAPPERLDDIRKAWRDLQG